MSSLHGELSGWLWILRPVKNGLFNGSVSWTFQDVFFEEIGYGELTLAAGTCNIEDQGRRDGDLANLTWYSYLDLCRSPSS